ncbi:hypothetical protein EJ04DRAFT_34818 [Polyplosphaeria fusca]|uniref:Zn(2)-C6 fungal-type domain-containing protein n=1 Tax=Polyplosphaeria fusca TaxID=682080 RepID=A0A9P4UZW0_9PLEO|nr:hypothetical protein EJ04DRAFT_34818 [Polyplosphaeria fusca]
MPKRSSGCFTCRARKVRCDEVKPECNNCLKRGQKCPGYRPTQTFVLHTFDRESERPGIIREDETIYKFANQHHTPFGNGRDLAVRTGSQQSGRIGTQLLRTVSPLAIERVQHLSNFLSLYLPNWTDETLTPPSALILSLPSTPASRPVFLTALDALSAAQIAVSDKNHVLINRSRSLYGAALGQMMKSVTKSHASQEDETLLATYLLALYEVFVGITNGHGFFYHVQGILRILVQRGPSSIKTNLSLGIFHGTRYYSLGIGYHIRKGSIFDSPDWLQVTADAAKSDPWVALMDLCICIPRLLERTDKLTTLAGDAEQFEKIIVDSQLLADRLFEWIVSYEKDGPRYDKVDVETVEGFARLCDDDLYDPVFAFKTFAASTTYLLYWMSMLIMRSNSFLLVRKFHALEPKQLFLWDRELSEYADCICRAVPYSSRPSAGYTGRFSTLTPLVIAKKYFEAKGASKENEWCRKAYFGAQVPGLYTPPIPMEPLPSFVKLVQNSERYI